MNNQKYFRNNFSEKLWIKLHDPLERKFYWQLTRQLGLIRYEILQQLLEQLGDMCIEQFNGQIKEELNE
jgi:hypothetical protein